MSAAEESPFVTAYNNHPFDIQNLNDASGVTLVDANGQAATGVYATTTFIHGGDGEVLGGSSDRYTDMSVLQKTNQYVLTVSQGFFAPYVISWGGPAGS